MSKVITENECVSEYGGHFWNYHNRYTTRIVEAGVGMPTEHRECALCKKIQYKKSEWVDGIKGLKG